MLVTELSPQPQYLQCCVSILSTQSPNVFNTLRRKLNSLPPSSGPQHFLVFSFPSVERDLCAGVLSLSTVSLKPIHIALCINTPFFFMAELYSTTWMYHSMCIHRWTFRLSQLFACCEQCDMTMHACLYAHTHIFAFISFYICVCMCAFA